MPDEKIRLTRLERHFLSNQLRILEALYPEEAEDLAIEREAVERGYEMLYDFQIQHIFDGDDVMTPEECLEVWDTFDMFGAIDRAIEELEQPKLRIEPGGCFSGYDGNNESKFMAFAAYTVKRLERFVNVRLAKENYWNSHMPVRGMYKRMLNEWKKLPFEAQQNLSKDALERILKAAPDPNTQRAD